MLLLYDLMTTEKTRLGTREGEAPRSELIASLNFCIMCVTLQFQRVRSFRSSPLSSEQCQTTTHYNHKNDVVLLPSTLPYNSNMTWGTSQHHLHQHSLSTL